MKLSGWGQYPVVDCRTVEVCRAEEARTVIHRLDGALIARGNGRAYGDAAVSAQGTLLTRRMNRILAFDPQTGDVTCEGGVLLEDLLTVFVPRGWFPPVTPGTRFASVGGMIAADVHGKNHHRTGTFGQHVHSLDLLQADGSTVSCSDGVNGGLFRATCGGMGLTGLILRATLRLQRIETAWIRQEVIPCATLQDSLSAFRASADWTYSVAWIDCLASGGALGRSLLFRGEHAGLAELPEPLRQAPLRRVARRSLSVPVSLPDMVLSPWSVRLFNAAYARRASSGGGLVDLDAFFYPLDGVRHWNRIYGRRGFVQFQCVLPLSSAEVGVRALLQATVAAGMGSFLSVLKLLGPGRAGLLSFPMEGYTLALDFPVCPGLPALLQRLEAIVCDCGGRLYLAKDATMAPQTLRVGYPELPEFQALRETVSASGRFASCQSQRLRI